MGSCVCIGPQPEAKYVHRYQNPLQHQSTPSSLSTKDNDTANGNNPYALRSHHQLCKKKSSSPSYLIPPEPEQVQYNKTLTSDNEFENDEYPQNSDSKIEEQYKIVSKSYVHGVLTNEPIIFDSLLKADLNGTTSYKDAAAILIKNKLYLTSATYYKIWMELMCKTKMDELIEDEEIKIENKLASQLIERLDIIEDDQKDTQLSDWFVGKTKKEIKLNVLLDVDNIIESLSFLLRNINSKEEESTNILQIELNDSHRVKGFEIKSDHHNIKRHPHKYGFYIHHNTKSQISCLLDSNNTRYEWMTHLYFVIYSTDILYDNDDHKIDDSQHHGISYCTRRRRTSSSIMNDFRTTIDYEGIINNFGETFSTYFNFGAYLNYWEKGYNESVSPKYATLRDELIRNNVAQISKSQYYQLYTQCNDLLKKRGYKIRAHDIGVNNKKFNVPKGSRITINHLIALKLYTDYGEIQKKFKKHCRKSKMNETMKDFIKRNSEIAHWCRYLKESCTFFGDLVDENDIFYTGLDTKLMFSSMRQLFECPLSTTTDRSIAEEFRNENGVILKVKASNSKTRCFDVAWLSNHSKEKERIFMGASLQICDIYIGDKSTEPYVSAMSLFEEIMTGKFINSTTKKTEKTLYSLIAEQKQPLPQYIDALFQSMNQRIREPNSIWINKKELTKIKHENLRNLFHIDGDENSYYSINGVDKLSINFVQQFKWSIDGDNYYNFKNKRPKECVESEQYKYIKEGEDIMEFHLSCFPKYSESSPKCALFLHLDEVPEHIEEIRIEYHLLCDKPQIYKHSISPQWLSKNKKEKCGFQAFSSNCLDEGECIIWKLGIKVIDIIQKPKGKCARSSSESEVKTATSAQQMEALERQRSKSMDDVERNTNGSIISLSTEQMIDLLNNKIFEEVNNVKVNENKDKFISFFRDKKIDGNAFISMTKKEFTANVADHHNNKKLIGPSRKVYIHLIGKQ